MARTERYTADQVIEALNRGYTALGAAQLLGCDAQTIRNYAAKYPTVDRALRAKRREMVDLAEMGLRGAILRGEGWAIMGVLKTLGKDEGYSERHEVTGKDGNGLRIAIEYVDAEIDAATPARRPADGN